MTRPPGKHFRLVVFVDTRSYVCLRAVGLVVARSKFCEKGSVSRGAGACARRSEATLESDSCSITQAPAAEQGARRRVPGVFKPQQSIVPSPFPAQKTSAPPLFLHWFLKWFPLFRILKPRQRSLAFAV